MGEALYLKRLVIGGAGFLKRLAASSGLSKEAGDRGELPEEAGG